MTDTPERALLRRLVEQIERNFRWDEKIEGEGTNKVVVMDLDLHTAPPSLVMAWMDARALLRREEKERRP